MQATVKTFDPDARSGVVYLDDGTELAFDANAFDAGGLRHLRLGQRVRLRTTDETRRGRVTIVTLATFDLPPLPVPPWERDD